MRSDLPVDLLDSICDELTELLRAVEVSTLEARGLVTQLAKAVKHAQVLKIFDINRALDTVGNNAHSEELEGDVSDMSLRHLDNI